MDDVINLINHLINSKYSIDRIDSISNQLNISKDQILKILRADRYKDYFQLLKHKNQGIEKIALTLDVSFYYKKKQRIIFYYLAFLLYTLCSNM